MERRSGKKRTKLRTAAPPTSLRRRRSYLAAAITRLPVVLLAGGRNLEVRWRPCAANTMTRIESDGTWPVARAPNHLDRALVPVTVRSMSAAGSGARAQSAPRPGSTVARTRPSSEPIRPVRRSWGRISSNSQSGSGCGESSADRAADFQLGISLRFGVSADANDGTGGSRRLDFVLRQLEAHAAAAGGAQPATAIAHRVAPTTSNFGASDFRRPARSRPASDPQCAAPADRHDHDFEATRSLAGSGDQSRNFRVTRRSWPENLN